MPRNWLTWTIETLATPASAVRSLVKPSPRDPIFGSLDVRQLEPRRVLDAALLDALAPSLTSETALVSSSTPAASAPAASFDWSTVAAEAPLGPSGSLLSAEAQGLSVDPTNTAPTLVNINVISIPENTPVFLTGNIVDPNPTDTFTLDIDWGDGSTQSVSLAAGTSFFAISHTFVDDNPTATPADIYNIQLVLTDSAGGVDEASTIALVGDEAPILFNLASSNGVEGVPLTISGDIIDRSPLDTFRLEVDWGDGSTSTFNYAAGTTSFAETHAYVDEGNYNVKLLIFDDDLRGNFFQLQTSVGNAPPVLSNLSATNINEHGVTTLSANLFDSGALDTFNVSIDWGDGSPVQMLSLPAGTSSFAVNHQYLDDNPTGTPVDNYLVQVTVLDSDGAEDSGSTSVTVSNVAPKLENVVATTIFENGTTTLSGNIFDPGTQDPFTLEIDWGDGLPTQTVLLPAGSTTFSVQHQYVDDNPTGTPSDLFTIKLKLADDDTGIVTTQVNVRVDNVAPTLQELSATNVNEHGSTTLTGKIIDPGTQDTFTLEVNWGDGTTQSFTYPAGTTTFSETHQYVDDNPTGTPSDNYTIKLKLTDDDTGVGTAETTIVFSNVAPLLTNVSATNVNEHGSTTLTGTIVDPGTQDTFTLEVNWGDGTIESFTYAAGTTTFSESHQYLDDNPTGTSIDNYKITLKLTDDDTGVATAEKTIVVSNVAPLLTNVSATNVNEHGSTTLTGTIVDPSTQDTFTLEVNWGDGTVESFTYAAGTTTFSESHQYLDDNPTGTPSDNFTIKLKLTDDDTGVGSAETTIVVSNVAPLLTGVSATNVNEQSSTTLTGTIVDPGTQDTFTLEVNWGDGVIESFTYAAGTTSFSETHQYPDDNPTGTPNDTYTIKLKLTDDDTGVGLAETTIIVTNLAPVIAEIAPQSLAEGALFSLTGSGGSLATFTDTGLQDTHAAVIDWGDGTQVDALTVTQGSGSGSLAGTHTYADNGVYTATITVVDDDGNAGQRSFTITVTNVAPVLTGTTGHTRDEGQAFTLGGLGVGLSDPGFDNSLNTVDPANGGETAETFTGMTIDWGDGSALTPVSVVNRVSGSAGALTTAGFDHTPHTYADNGSYTVTVSFTDDDGGAVALSFTITVNNVAPSLTLTSEQFTLNEGQTLTIPQLGSFTDPGFNNPLRPGGASQETFRYTINWGDGTPTESVDPTPATNGSPGTLTSGTFGNSHLYRDNDVDSTYTITVTLTDDDGGSATKSFNITVLNVNPTLNSAGATDLEAAGVTTLTIVFTDPGADVITVWVDWGDKLSLPPEQRFVAVEMHAGATPFQYVTNYAYSGPPDPQNPSADIIITAFVRDDDFGTPAGNLGQSNSLSVAIDNPGTEGNNIAIDTTLQIPAVDFPRFVEVTTANVSQAGAALRQQLADVRGSGADASAVAERYFELRVRRPDGTLSDGVRLKNEALDDLPKLFRSLPDNRYVIYLVRTENNSRRLVMDVTVRNGRVIDPSDDSDGARDRPPTEESAPEPAENNTEPEANTQPQARVTPVSREAEPIAFTGEELLPGPALTATALPPQLEPTLTPTGRYSGAAAALAMSLVVARDWPENLRSAFGSARAEDFRRLRRRKPR